MDVVFSIIRANWQPWSPSESPVDQVARFVKRAHHSGPVLVPALVVTEVAYQLGTRVGVETEVRLFGGQARPR